MSRYPEHLVEAACRGDDQAITRLLSAAQPDIRRYAQRSCRTTTDVEDAVQEVLIILHRRMPTLTALGSISSWLFVIAHRVCLRFFKSLLPGEDVALLPRPDIARADPTELRIDLARAIESLPEQYRVVLILRDCEGFTIAEIAQRLEITREATKARLHRGRKLVREYLGTA